MTLDTKTILILTFEPDEVAALRRAIIIALDETTSTDAPHLWADDSEFLRDLSLKL